MTERFIPQQLWNDEFRFLKLRQGGKEPSYDMLRWQEDNFKYNDFKLLNHIEHDGNYGIIGGFGNLIIIDADSEEVNNIAKSLPETFTIKTGSPIHYKHHYYYIVDKEMKAIRLSKEKVGDLGDIRAKGQYVVGPNCLHPTGGTYKITKDIPISKITEKQIKEFFSSIYDRDRDHDEKKEFEIDTKLRNSKYVRECNVPDYLMNNKVKGNTSKNWELFPYVVDIMYNRQSNQQAYINVVKKQEHQEGALKGWVQLAHQGKLMKGSCKKMQEYLNKFHPEIIGKVCGYCPLYKIRKIIEEIKGNINYSQLQKKVLTNLLLGKKDEATEMIVQEIKKSHHIYTTKDDIKSEMWVYKNGIYLPQGKSFVKEFSRNILGKTFTSHIANNIIGKIEADTFIEHDKFFSSNYQDEIPILNGILNIRTRTLSDFNPKKIFFNKLPVKYDAAQECPKIIEHLKTVLKGKEDIPVLLELFGYLLFKEYRIEKAFMFVGFGRNGKSKTIELMKLFLGPENCASLPLRSLNDESFSLCELFGKMANLAADLSKTDLKETGMIKALIGRDTVQAKRKFLRDLNFVNYAKMIFAANELPKIYDTTEGFWTKWVLIEFPYKFVTEKEYNELPEEEKLGHKILNPDIIKELTTPEELSGLLNLALDGLDRIIKNNDFSYSKGTKEVKDLWIRKSDSFTAFCMDHITEELEGKITKKDLRKMFFKYCKLHKLRGIGDKVIKITLENLFGASESQEYQGERYWEGIKFRNEVLLE